MAANDNVALGLAYLNEGNKVKAKEKLLFALEESPNNPLVLDSMAYFWEVTQNVALASAFYQKAYDIAPNDGAALNNYAVFLCKHGQEKKAETLFLKAVHLQNYVHTAKAYENAGVCALKAGESAKAKEYFTKALVN
ncbi:MAG: tetratricopeptide repeat protein [Gammaproteobacteria bacterium]|nr:tetratricopeptide repeat protein [Gammaproteobacteria bacterium]